MPFRRKLSKRQQYTISPVFNVPPYASCVATVTCRLLSISMEPLGRWSEPAHLWFDSPQTGQNVSEVVVFATIFWHETD